MPMTTCPDCRREVSTDARACPGCGRPLATPGTTTGSGCLRAGLATVLAGGAAFALFVVGAIFLTRQPPVAVDRTPDARVSATDLVRAYTDNEVAADERFKGRFVAVYGRVENIGKGLSGGAYVVLDGPGLWDVQCFADADSLVSLRRGVEIEVVGKVGGKFGNVLLNDCAVSR